MKPLVIGSRGSALALWQAKFISREIQERRAGAEVEILVIKTTGDKISEGSLRGLPPTGKGVFIKEIEEALLAGRIDLAVHSLKDVPTELAPEFALAAIPPRADPRDALVAGSEVDSWEKLPEGARLGTSSLRRTAQLRALRRDFGFHVLRGNVDTRIRKREELGLDGVVLAAAGLGRLGLTERISYLFPPEVLVPAVGQGALAVEIRAGDQHTLDLVGCLDNSKTRACVEAERLFLKEMGGGCQVPMGAHAVVAKDTARFIALVASPVRDEILRYVGEGEPARLTDLGAEAARQLRSQGADRILKELEL